MSIKNEVPLLFSDPPIFALVLGMMYFQDQPIS